MENGFVEGKGRWAEVITFFIVVLEKWKCKKVQNRKLNPPNKKYKLKSNSTTDNYYHKAK